MPGETSGMAPASAVMGFPLSWSWICSARHTRQRPRPKMRATASCTDSGCYLTPRVAHGRGSSPTCAGRSVGYEELSEVQNFPDATAAAMRRKTSANAVRSLSINSTCLKGGRPRTPGLDAIPASVLHFLSHIEVKRPGGGFAYAGKLRDRA